MLISVHIPKCAGTSFRHVLQGLYGERIRLNYGEIFSRAQARPALVPAGTACIHGHFFADAFDDFYPKATFITWLRHPVERVVSNYEHFLRSPDWRDDCCRALYGQRLGLREFAELEWMRNMATRYLADKSLAEFAFVGVAERFSESLHVFGAACGWPTDLPAPRENINPLRARPRYSLAPETYEHLLALNGDDLAIYEQAVARLDALLDRESLASHATCAA